VALRRTGARERRGTPAEFLVVGLANPGEKYARTRHNIGGDAVELLAARHRATLKVEPRQRARLAEITVAGHRVALAVPTTFMNESGAALPGLLSRTGASAPDGVVVVHDELDLEPGRLQLKVGGGLAGHNGLRSISSTLATTDFLRLRIGVGRPPRKEMGADWVLSRPGKADAEILAIAAEQAADAIELLAERGVDAAMNVVNARG
jgi:PTH1 family peptidyl-tRNA hydrolase